MAAKCNSSAILTSHSHTHAYEAAEHTDFFLSLERAADRTHEFSPVKRVTFDISSTLSGFPLLLFLHYSAIMHDRELNRNIPYINQRVGVNTPFTVHIELSSVRMLAGKRCRVPFKRNYVIFW